MAKRGAATEVYVEEIAKVEQEIALMQHELSDAHQLNDELAKKIEKKDMDLLLRDEKLGVLREKNAAELDVLQLEFAGERDKYQHEIAFHESEVQLLTVNKDRMKDLENENTRLSAAIRYLEEQINTDSTAQALAMHEMNRNMLALRHQMELKLRRELTGLDISFQKEAFHALHERQKQAMFENAKLKDEVALQGVGIANLSARLAKQKILFDKCQKQLHLLNQKPPLIQRMQSDGMREQLASIAMEKSRLAKLKDILRFLDDQLTEYFATLRQYESQSASLSQQKSQLLTSLQSRPVNPSQLAPSSLYSSPCTPTLTHTFSSSSLPSHVVLSECLSKYAAICEVNARWQKRFSVLQQIRGELRPMLNKVAERIEVMKAAALAGDGDGVAVTLPTHAAPAVPSAATGLAANQAAKPSATADDASANSMDAIDQLIPTLTWADLIDADLLKLFAPLQGMESNFLSAMHSIAVQEHIDRKCDVTDEKEQNMMAWGLLKIFHTWYCEEPDEQQVELANSMSELSQSLSEHSFFASPRTSPGRQQEQHLQHPAHQEQRPMLQQPHRQQVPNKKWLSKPSSHTPNIFAAQIKDQLISPSRPTRYTVQENDKILQADVEQKRVVHRGGFGPPIVIRSHCSANSSALMEPMSVAESVSFVSALPSVVEDPLLKKKKQLRNSASGSALPSGGKKKTLRGMKAANKSAGALTYPTPPPSSPGQLRIA